MKPSDFQKTVMCRFDSCLKKTVFGVVKDYYKELKKNQAEAIPFCELPDIIIDKVAIWDTYKTDYTTWHRDPDRCALHQSRHGNDHRFRIHASGSPSFPWQNDSPASSYKYGLYHRKSRFHGSSLH